MASGCYDIHYKNCHKIQLVTKDWKINSFGNGLSLDIAEADTLQVSKKLANISSTTTD